MVSSKVSKGLGIIIFAWSCGDRLGSLSTSSCSSQNPTDLRNVLSQRCLFSEFIDSLHQTPAGGDYGDHRIPSGSYRRVNKGGSSSSHQTTHSIGDLLFVCEFFRLGFKPSFGGSEREFSSSQIHVGSRREINQPKGYQLINLSLRFRARW